MLICLRSANVYSNGKSEEIIGNAIKEYKIPREKLVLLSKCYGYVGEEYVLYFPRCSTSYIRRLMESLLPLAPASAL